MKTTTVRLPPDLDKDLTDYAKREDISKNQAIRKAVRILLGYVTHTVTNTLR